MPICLQVGIDDTDSAAGGCTTYLAANVLETLVEAGYTPAEYPSLVRLNPNIPWKTRGNAAVSLRVFCEPLDVEFILDRVISLTEKCFKLSHEANDPGIVALKEGNTANLVEFSKEAMCGIVNAKQAQKVLAETGGTAVGFGKARGILGALAAIGYDMGTDHTFEMISYRIRKNLGLPRRVNKSSVARMDAETKPFTYNNLDPESNRILVTPHGPDPILFGVRGETPDIVMNAAKSLVSDEDVERWLIFRTNQGTDAHFQRAYRVKEIRPFNSVVLEGTVMTHPATFRGGHVIFRVGDTTGEVNCAAYQPTGRFRNDVRKLIPGDVVRVYGGVRRASPNHERIINLEKLLVLKLCEKTLFANPVCKECGGASSSLGRNQGFRCRRCGRAYPDSRRISLRTPRELKPGLYMPPPRAHRHLTKPFRRYGLEKTVTTRHGIFSSEEIWGLGSPTNTLR